MYFQWLPVFSCYHENDIETYILKSDPLLPGANGLNSEKHYNQYLLYESKLLWIW